MGDSSSNMILDDPIETIDMTDMPSINLNDLETPLSEIASTIIPNATPAITTTTTAGTLHKPLETDRRPFDDLGPPADPLDYPRPRIERGRRANVVCYFPSNGKEQVVKNVLFRDFSRCGGIQDGACGNASDASRQRSTARDDVGDNKVKEAYWPVPHKRPIKTIMGHVEICFVLERCLSSSSGRGSENDDHDVDDDNSDSHSSGNDDDDEDDDDIVFQLTDKRVAVKVNYANKMERLRNRHAEDPLKEISAMQIIGDHHPHVLGCRDVLFDSKTKTLNVIMRYLQAGDLFELLQHQQHQSPTSPPANVGMPEGRARYWFRQFVAGVDYLHSVGICHRDLSPENVMIDQANHCLIIDMGMALRVPYLNTNPTPAILLGERTTSDTVYRITDISRGTQQCLVRPQGACGKLPYMSPEIFRNRDPFSAEAVDLFTAGTILFCMLTGNRSYQNPHSSDPQFYWMTHGLEFLLADWNIQLSPEGLHLLKNLLQVNPRLRLTLHEVKHHPWLQQPDDPPPLQTQPTR